MKATQGKPMVLISSLLTLGTILEAPTLPVTAAPPNQIGFMTLSERRRTTEQTEVVLVGPSWCASTVGGGMGAGNFSTEIGKLAASMNPGDIEELVTKNPHPDVQRRQRRLPSH